MSLSSNFCKPIASPDPVPRRVDDIFTGFSFSSPLKDLSSDVTDHKREDPYEDIELIKNNIPQPTPRRSLMVNNSVSERTDVTGNIFRDVREVDNCDNITYNDSDTVTRDMVNNVEESRVIKQLGARPKNSMTMDIRKKISEWYEEAEKEVERDLTLDISQLEIRKTRVRSVPVPQSYEHVSYGVRGGGGGGSEKNCPQKPTMTLLRAFDPCFDIVKKEDDAFEERDEKSHTDDDSDNLYDKIDELKAAESPRAVPSPPAVKPRSVTSTPSPKNIGPPKPPRNYNYPPKTEVAETISPAKKGLKSMISESNIFKRSPRCDEDPESVEVGTKNLEREFPSGGSENIYVTAPVWNSADAVSDISSDALSGDIHRILY